MSVARFDVVDAVTARDGWAVLSIHEFGDWADLDDPADAVRRKLGGYFDHIESARFLARYHRLPVRIELVSREPVPDGVAALCRRLGVIVHEGER